MTNKTKIFFLNPQNGLKGNKYILDYEKIYPYFIEHIDSGKSTLYSKIRDTIDFKNGEFFTFLTESTQTKTLYELEGGIMRPLPKDSVSEPEDFNIDDLSYEFILDFLNKNSTRMLILDQFIVQRKKLELEGMEVVTYENEIYYVLNSNTPIDSISFSIGQTDHLWHCLGILTDGLRQPVISLKEEDFDLICKNLKYIFTTVYDGEGYLFWEKKY